MTMSQIPDVNRELAEVGAMFAVFEALRRSGGREGQRTCTDGEIRTPDLRFTKPAPTVSQRSSASIFDRLRSIDSAIETLREERQALLAELETIAERGEDA